MLLPAASASEAPFRTSIRSSLRAIPLTCSMAGSRGVVVPIPTLQVLVSDDDVPVHVQSARTDPATTAHTKSGRQTASLFIVPSWRLRQTRRNAALTIRTAGREGC